MSAARHSTEARVPNRTIGISPKVLYPALAALAVVAQQWASTGRFDRTELVTLVVTLVYAAVGYVAPPGEVSAAGRPATAHEVDQALLDYDGDDFLIDGLSIDAEDQAPDLPLDDAGTLVGAGGQR